MKEKSKRKKIGKYDSKYLEASRVVCECGHTINFFSNTPYVECSHCHKIVFRNQKTEYDFRIKRRFGVSNEKKKKSL